MNVQRKRVATNIRIIRQRVDEVSCEVGTVVL